MIKKISIGIKTFCRPMVLEFCLSKFALEEKYGGIQIIIADDSTDNYKKENQEIIHKLEKVNDKVNLKYINLPFDTGLSYGRNRIVESCNTEYILIIDDSRTIDKNTRIFDMVRFLEETNYDLIAGVISKGRSGVDTHYSGIFDEIHSKNNVVHIKIKKKNELIKNNFFKNVYKTNIVLNVFVARVSALLKNKWYEELKVGEHEFFFYNFFKNNFKCAVTTEVNFLQSPDNIIAYPPHIFKFRERAHVLYEKYVKLHWN